MGKMIKNVGLDVHKNSISIGIADDGRDDEGRFYGKIDNDMNQLDQVIRILISKGAVIPMEKCNSRARVMTFLIASTGQETTTWLNGARCFSG